MPYFSTLWPHDSSTPHIAFSRSNILLNFVFEAKQKPSCSRSCQEEVGSLRRLQSLVAICAVYFNCSANYMMRVCVVVCHSQTHLVMLVWVRGPFSGCGIQNLGSYARAISKFSNLLDQFNLGHFLPFTRPTRFHRFVWGARVRWNNHLARNVKL